MYEFVVELKHTYKDSLMPKSTLFTQLTTLEELTSEYRKTELRRIAKNKDTPTATLVLLAGHEDIEIKDNVLGNTNTPNSVIQPYIDRLKKVSRADKHSSPDRYAVSWAARQHGNLSRSIQEYFAGEPELVSYFASNPKADYDLLTKIADQEILRPTGLSYNLAQNKGVKKDILLKLYNSGNAEIWRGICGNIKLPASVLTDMYEKATSKEKANLVPGITRNSSASPELLEKIYDEYEDNRTWLVLNPSVSHDFLMGIIRDRNAYARGAAVSNRKITVEDLLELIATGKREDADIAIMSKKLPAKEVTNLLNRYIKDNTEEGRDLYGKIFYSAAFKVARGNPDLIVPEKPHPYSTRTERVLTNVLDRFLYTHR